MEHRMITCLHDLYGCMMVRESMHANMQSHTADEEGWEDGSRDMQQTWIVVGARRSKAKGLSIDDEPPTTTC